MKVQIAEVLRLFEYHAVWRDGTHGLDLDDLYDFLFDLGVEVDE